MTISQSLREKVKKHTQQVGIFIKQPLLGAGTWKEGILLGGKVKGKSLLGRGNVIPEF